MAVKPPIKEKYFKTPEDLYQFFEEYRSDVKDNPRKKKIKGNKDYTLHDEDLERPLTMEGFQVYGFKNGKTVDHYFSNSNNAYEAYCSICSIIKMEIRQDQIEGGMVGQYNPSITQRLNNIVDKQEIEQKGSETKTIIFRHEPLDE
jgi:hypothetical protein